MRIADLLLPRGSAEAIRNPQSAIRNELQAVKQRYHLGKNVLKHSQMKMSVTRISESEEVTLRGQPSFFCKNGLIFRFFGVDLAGHGQGGLAALSRLDGVP